ncbi:universal stress protein [Halobacteria archaeon AArc-m2/3/4]|uniref:Universal stress protein n=1 Tax=Natronoglomus mannanivorans TaxID=2979990 RepID=A0AAP2Z1B7_9EURY|nr:universal stress protein [Halobacteria archaeon AArc-xg1-1]MCU4973878.1 universal stress protein [Halobacteria archaeon AArc-m2/3/4]
MKHVLVPIDGSEPAWKALDHAASVFAGGRITVLHVVDPAAGMYTGVDGGYFDTEAFERAKDRGEDLCERASERLRDDDLEGIDLATAVEAGRPARTIVEYVSEHDVDHVVMGSRGRTGVSRMLLGSVAETVTRRSPVPVTIVR